MAVAQCGSHPVEAALAACFPAGQFQFSASVPERNGSLPFGPSIGLSTRAIPCIRSFSGGSSSFLFGSARASRFLQGDSVPMTSSVISHASEPVSADFRNIERDQARAVQQSLLPTATLARPDCQVSCRYSPLTEVGGDFADYFSLPDGKVGIYLGDVVGKGLPAAMYGALVMGMLRGIHKTGTDTSAVLALLNKRLLVRPVPAHYCSTIYAVYDPPSRRLCFSNAGLPYPLHASSESVATLEQSGIPSGLFPGTEYDALTVTLSPGDTILFATDGVHEMRNAAREDFSWQQLGKIWQRSRRFSADESVDMLFDELHVFSSGAPRHDDVTAVVLKIPEGV